MRQSRDQIDVDIYDPGCTQASDFFEHDKALMQPSHRRSFLVHKRLDAKADAVHTTTEKSFHQRVGQRSRSAFHRDLSLGTHLKLPPHGAEDAFELSRVQ